MKNAVLIFLVLFLSAGLIAQKPGAGKKRPSARPAAAAPVPVQLSDKEQFDAASKKELAAERISALQKFLKDFPGSEYRISAEELISSSRMLMAEERLLAGDRAGSAELFKLAVGEAPKPYSAEFFRESIAPIPSTLFWRGARPAAFELARLIEGNAAGQADQLVELANFYISIENGDEALRLAQAAIAADPNSATAHRTLALAYRVNFELEQSAAAYAKAVELWPDSAAAKRGLAEMKRALGQPAEAAALYRELLAANDNDPPARTGLILALFEEGKQAEAEAELAKSLEQNPSNVILLAGAAYWYAANKNGDKAIELAKTAIEKEPRYIWSHIAMARGYMVKKDPVKAEQVLLAARKYGNFPTLEYEIATARLAAGFYRDAAEGLVKSFTVHDGTVQTKLGGRVPRTAESFTDLVAYERKASIFSPTGADSPEYAEQLKRLIEFTQKINASELNEAEAAAAADAFAAGTDNMRLHRQLYAANALLQKKIALPKVLELTQAATGNTDTGLEVSNPSAAVMASELYDSRSIAFARDEFLLVPDVPKQTLSAIMRGRVEEITGWTLYQQDNFPAAVVRLRRAVSVLPTNSAWWRSSLWRLGAAQEASGLDKEALSSYVESFRADKPDYAKYVILESLYKKINGSTDGLDVLLGQALPAAATTTSNVTTPAVATPSQTKAGAVPNSEPKADTIKERAQPEIRIPRSVPVAVEPVKTESAAAATEQKTDAPVAISQDKSDSAASVVAEKTGEVSSSASPAVDSTPVDTAAPVTPAGNGNVQGEIPQQAKEATVKTDTPPAEVPSDAKTEVKIEAAELPANDVVKAEEEKAAVPAPTSDTHVATSEPAPAEEKKAETPTQTLDPPVVAKEPITPEESKTVQKVDITPVATKKEEASTQSAEIKPEEEIPPPVRTTSDEPKATPVETRREEPPSPPDSRAKTEARNSPAASIKTEDTPPPVRLKVERTSTIPLDGESPIVITPKKLAPKTPTESGRQAAAKSLFEPVVITVPKRTSEPNAKRETKPQPFEPIIITVPRSGSAGNTGAANPRTDANRSSDHDEGSTRPRIVSDMAPAADQKSACIVTSNKNEISVIRNDGGVGLLVGLSGTGDIGSIEAISSSPAHVEVVPVEVSGTGDGRFFIVRSISEKLGIFQVRFEAPCGSSEISVTVR